MTGRGEATHRVLLLTADALVRQQLERAAPAVEVVSPRAGVAVEPTVVVLDLDAPGSIDEVARVRCERPDVFIAGHVGLPRHDVWLRAQQAGCDLVANRGAFAGTLLRKLPAPGERRRRLFPLLPAAELPGRIGLVVRAPETKHGPVAVYHFSGTLCAVADVCPHAGATLSTGELEGTVITCPRHGSQFDVRDGTRRRGPADVDLATFTAVEEDGFLCLVEP